MAMSIVTDKNKLTSACQTTSVLEGMEIGKRLLKILAQQPSGVGLAANQIGVDKRVCVVNVEKPWVLVNPRIVFAAGTVEFNEGCLSFPGQYIITTRYEMIVVVADNHPRLLFFDSNENILECVCVQHEIDHLNGITMHDRRKK